MRFSSRSCSSLRVLRLYLKVAIFQEHAPRTTFVLKSCIFKPELPRTRGESNPGPRDCESRRAHHETTSKSRFASKKIARRHSESASTRTISAEGSSGSRQMRTAPQRERSDTHDPRRGFIGLKTNSHGATARALRHAGSPQRVRQGQDKFARRHSESASTRTISAEGSPRSSKFARRHSESASTRRISAEGSPRSRQIRTAPQRERFDTHDLRRGFAKVKTNSHGATARALRHAGSPQRVRRAQDKFARRHSESASTRTISAEGSPRSRQIRTAPQRERFDTHDLRRGVRFVSSRRAYPRHKKKKKKKKN